MNLQEKVETFQPKTLGPKCPRSILGPKSNEPQIELAK